MKTLKATGFLIILLLINLETVAQNIPIEIFTGDKAYKYQHSFQGQINQQFGISHSSSLLEFYKVRNTEIMTQTYATIALGNRLKLGLGTFYASVPGFIPSMNLQFTKKNSEWLFLLVARMDLSEKPSYELMMMSEFKPIINNKLKLYSRIQIMENFTGLNHNRGYSHFRVGLYLKNIQVGLAVGLESYGKKYSYEDIYGLFVRTSI